MADANVIIEQLLEQYGLGSLTTWALNEAAAGASVDQITQDMRSTAQFKARFPGIALRESAGLPPISPAEYIAYEDTLNQMVSRYGLPQGVLTSPDRVAKLIGGDVSPGEVDARLQQGFAAVAYAPPEVRQFFAQNYGVAGDGALASYFLDQSKTASVLTQQATSAQIGGQAAIGGISMNGQDAFRLAQLGQTSSSVGAGLASLQQRAPLFDASIAEQPNIAQGTQGVEAQFGLNATATQEVLQRQEARQAAFSGGGGPITDPYGAHGAGAAKPT